MVEFWLHMLESVDFLTLLLVVLFAAAVFYPVSFLRNKMVGYFSLLQLIYLVVVPGFIFPLAYSYLQSMLSTPRHDEAFLNDGLLVNAVLLSALFTYGGVAIHAVTKMLSNTDLRHEQSDAAKLNRFFHLRFSHNLMFGGTMTMLIALTLLELNHLPTHGQIGAVGVVVKSAVIASVMMVSLWFYTRSRDLYSGRWADLKLAFGLVWMLLVVVMYGLRRIRPGLDEYQLLIPVLFALMVFSLLNLILVVRKLKRGGWRVVFRWKRLARLVQSEGDAD